MWTIISGIALTLGGIWLQNQYTALLKVQEQQTEFTRFVDAEYVDKKYLDRVLNETERRLGSIEGKLDSLLQLQVNEKHAAPPFPPR